MSTTPDYGCKRCQYTWSARSGPLCPFCGGGYTDTFTPPTLTPPAPHPHEKRRVAA